MLFEFNLYSALLLPGFLQGTIFTVLLLVRGWRDERSSDLWLATFLLLCTLEVCSYMLGFAGWYDAHNGYTTFMFYFPWSNRLLVGPIIYFYFRSLTNTTFRPERRQLWYLLPGVVQLLSALVVWVVDLVVRHWLLDQPLPYFYGTKGWWCDFSLPVLDHPVFGLLWTYLFLFLTIREFSRYKKYVRNFFSDTRDIEFSWLRNLLIGFTAVLTFVWVIILVDNFVVELHYTQNWFGFLAISILIYYLSVAGYAKGEKVPMTLQFSPEAPDIPNEEVTPAAGDEELEIWKVKVSRLMQDQRPYLHPELTLPEMAQLLGTNTSVLSRVINQGFAKNFNDYINTYRVEAVKTMLEGPAAQQLTFLAIAMDCGFNSKATFNRAFRKFTGMSPKEYQEREGH